MVLIKCKLNIKIYIRPVKGESWGRYWGWDPKETWGLDRWIQSLLSVVAFYSVIMAFFGVNVYLSGMHSYGSTDGAIHLTRYLLLSFLLLLAIAIPSRIKYLRQQ